MNYYARLSMSYRPNIFDTHVRLAMSQQVHNRMDTWNGDSIPLHDFRFIQPGNAVGRFVGDLITRQLSFF